MSLANLFQEESAIYNTLQHVYIYIYIYIYISTCFFYIYITREVGPGYNVYLVHTF